MAIEVSEKVSYERLVPNEKTKLVEGMCYHNTKKEGVGRKVRVFTSGRTNVDDGSDRGPGRQF